MYMSVYNVCACNQHVQYSLCTQRTCRCRSAWGWKLDFPAHRTTGSLPNRQPPCQEYVKAQLGWHTSRSSNLSKKSIACLGLGSAGPLQFDSGLLPPKRIIHRVP